MNALSTSRFSAALVLLAGVTAIGASRPKDYENFSLPSEVRRAVPTSGLAYASDRIKLRGGNARMQEPNVNRRDYMFAKESFLAEKRDQAIKLLRQELDSGFVKNRDNLLLRLGQLYAEKYMELSYLENELYTQRLVEFQKTKKGPAPKADNGRSQSYLRDSLALFYQLERDFPRHPKLDEILFFIGFVEMESGKGEKGAKYLERVIRNYPNSRKYDDALVYLGDYFFDRLKFKEAEPKYRLLMRKTDSSLYDYALYKIAWCELNTNNRVRALKDLKALIGKLEGSNDKVKFNLRDQAIKDLVVFYGEADKVDDAFDYIQGLVGREKAVVYLRQLADLLRAKGRDWEAVTSYRRLLNENPDTLEAPLIELGISECLARLNKREEAIASLVRCVEQYGENSDWAKNYPEDKKNDLKSTLEAVRAEATRQAFFFHAAAQSGTNKGLYNYALRIYGVLLAHFPNHPEKKKIAFYRAEIFFAQQKWVEAANLYMAASKIPPKDKMTDEAVYNALLALDRFTAKVEKLEKYGKDDKAVDMTPQEIPEGERRFIEVAEIYVKEYPQGARIVDVRFRIAAIYYRFHHFDKALEAFREIALKHPKHRTAMTAAGLVLDIYNLKKDYENLDRQAQVFAGTPGLGDEKFRAELAQIRSQIGFKKIESLEGQGKWNDAAESYLAVYKQNPNGQLAEKSLYNAYVSFEKGGDLEKGVETAKLFIAKFPKSPFAQKMTLSLAKQAERQYDFEMAQRLYQEFHQKFPGDKEAKKALYNAAVFAELLERNREALDLYTTYLKDKSVSEADRRAVQISMAKIHRKLGELDKMALDYRRLVRDAKNADQRVAFLGELARQYLLAGRTNEKNALLAEIRAMYLQSGKDAKQIGPAIQFVGEAAFRSVDRSREKYDKIELRFPPEDLVYLMRRKQKQLLKLAEEYDAVVAVGVPDWGVAALHEKGQAYLAYVDSFRKLAIPKKYQGAERQEVEKGLKQIDVQQIQPLEKTAQEIWKACADRAAEFKVVNEYSERCRARLANKEKDAEGGDPVGLKPLANYWSTRPVGNGSVTQ